MNYFRLGSILFYTLTKLAYDHYAPPKDVWWSISYFVAHNLLLLLIIIELFLEGNKLIRGLLIILGLYYIVSIYQNLNCVFCTYQEWLTSVNNEQLDTAIGLGLFLSLIYYSLWLRK